MNKSVEPLSVDLVRLFSHRGEEDAARSSAPKKCPGEDSKQHLMLQMQARKRGQSSFAEVAVSPICVVPLLIGSTVSVVPQVEWFSHCGGRSGPEVSFQIGLGS